MCSESVLVPIPDHLWEHDGIYNFDPSHPEYGINAQGEKCLTLDACIVPTIKILWAAGVVTLSCCCGHGGGWSVITVQSQETPGARGAMVLRQERYEDLVQAEADRAAQAERADRAERYARSLEDEIVFKLQGDILSIHEELHMDDDELRAKAGDLYEAATQRWRELFAASPIAVTDSAEPRAGQPPQTTHEYMACAPGGCVVPVPLISETHGMCHWPYGNGPYNGGPFCSSAESDHDQPAPPTARAESGGG